MKKRMIIIMTLIAIIAMVAGTAAAPLKSRSFRLVDTRFVNGTGVVFIFSTTGEFTKADMSTAFAYAGGDSLDTYCEVREDVSQIVCTVFLVNQYVGKDIVVGLLGQGYWTTVPAKPVKTGGACLGVAVEETWVWEGGGGIFTWYVSFEELNSWGGLNELRQMLDEMVYLEDEFSYTLDLCVTDASLFGEFENES